jgi:phosphate/sulfate permease
VELAIIVVVIVVALVFDYTNGFHDAANAIATSSSNPRRGARASSWCSRPSSGRSRGT